MIKINNQKAYDTYTMPLLEDLLVSWGSLESVLSKWVRLVEGFFPSKWGLCQDNSLSPELAVIAMKIFSKLLYFC